MNFGCASYQSNISLASRILYAFEKGIGTDVKFEVGPSKTIIKCHKLVLIVNSEYFESFFSRWDSQTAGTPIPLPNINADDFELLLKHIYWDRISLPETVANSLRLLSLAVYFLVPVVKDRACRNLEYNLSIENSVLIYTTAKEYNIDQLSSAAFNCMINYGANFLQSKSFLELDDGSLKELLSSDKVQVDEMIIFEALLKWIEANRENVASEDFLKRNTHILRFGLISYPTLIEKVVPRLAPGILDKENLTLLSSGQFERLPVVFNSKPRSNDKWFNPYKEMSIFERGIFVEDANRLCRLRVKIKESILLLGVRSTLVAAVGDQDEGVVVKMVLSVTVPSSAWETSTHSQLGACGNSAKVIFDHPLLIPPKSSFDICLRIQEASKNSVVLGATSFNEMFDNPTGFNFEMIGGKFATHGIIESLIYI